MKDNLQPLLRIALGRFGFEEIVVGKNRRFDNGFEPRELGGEFPSFEQRKQELVKGNVKAENREVFAE